MVLAHVQPAHQLVHAIDIVGDLTLAPGRHHALFVLADAEHLHQFHVLGDAHLRIGHDQGIVAGCKVLHHHARLCRRVLNHQSVGVHHEQRPELLLRTQVHTAQFHATLRPSRNLINIILRRLTHRYISFDFISSTKIAPPLPQNGTKSTAPPYPKSQT